jgi:hypothetical protein
MGEIHCTHTDTKEREGVQRDGERESVNQVGRDRGLGSKITSSRGVRSHHLPPLASPTSAPTPSPATTPTVPSTLLPPTPRSSPSLPRHLPPTSASTSAINASIFAHLSRDSDLPPHSPPANSAPSLPPTLLPSPPAASTPSSMTNNLRAIGPFSAICSLLAFLSASYADFTPEYQRSRLNIPKKSVPKYIYHIRSLQMGLLRTTNGSNSAQG